MVLGQIGEFKRRPPKNARSRRELRKQEAKAFENPKKCLFLRGASTSQTVTDAMNDIYQIVKPHCKKLKKRNAFNPFEGVDHLQFLGFKNDCSMVCWGSDSKKRRNNLVIGRMFDFHMLDMVEFGIVAFDRLEIGGAKGSGAASLGSKPVFVFEGSEFETEPYFVRLKNLLVDFFRGSSVREIDVNGVERAIFVSLRSSDGTAVMAPSDDCRGTKPPTVKGNAILCFRHYALVKGKSAVSAMTATAAANAELVDIGPNFDLEVRRTFWAPGPEFKRACRLSREEMAEVRASHENVTGDTMGNLKGQLHVGKQNVDELNIRRFKAHRIQTEEKRAAAKKSRDAADAEAGMLDTHDDSVAPSRKKSRKVRRDAEDDHFALAPEADI